MVDIRNKKDPIPGYTGCMPSKEEQPAEYQQIAANGQIPGYVGYIPAVKPENLYGKTYGKITENCYNGKYHQGIDHPPPVRFTSSVKDTFVDPKTVKEQEALEGKINGLKTSTFSSAGRSLVGFGNTSQKDQTPAPVTQLTYEQACKKAYGK